MCDQQTIQGSWTILRPFLWPRGTAEALAAKAISNQLGYLMRKRVRNDPQSRQRRKRGRGARVLFLVSPPVWLRGSKAIPNTHAYSTHTLTRAHTPQVPSHMLFGMKNCHGSPCFISVINCERERARKKERAREGETLRQML